MKLYHHVREELWKHLKIQSLEIISTPHKRAQTVRGKCMDYRDCIIIAKKFYETENLRECLEYMAHKLNLKEGVDYKIIYNVDSQYEENQTYEEYIKSLCKAKYNFLVETFRDPGGKFYKSLKTVRIIRKGQSAKTNKISLDEIRFGIGKYKGIYVSSIVGLVLDIEGYGTKPVNKEKFIKLMKETRADSKKAFILDEDTEFDEMFRDLRPYEYALSTSDGIWLDIADKMHGVLSIKYSSNEPGLEMFKSTIEYYNRLQKLNSILG